MRAGAKMRRWFQALSFAILVLTCGQTRAQLGAPSSIPPPPAERAAIVSPTINIRLDPALGEDQPQLREFLSHYPYVRIAEPADYELTSKRDFPLMLTMRDLRDPRDYWYEDFTKPLKFYTWPETFELGNLEQGDYRASLNLAFEKIERIRTLLRLGDQNAHASIRSCALIGPDTICHWGSYREISGHSSPDDIFLGDLSETRVTNLTGAPRYLTAFWIDNRLGIRRATPSSGADEATPSGGEISFKPLAADPVRGPTWLVTIASEHPIAASAIEQAEFGEDQTHCSAATDARCATFSQLPADRDGWTVNIAEYRNFPPHPAGLGGGEDVLKGMAAWMAELYSTASNFDRLKADDVKKNVAKQEYAGQDAAEIAHRCGGTLIAKDLVVTAAHCVANKADFGGSAILSVPRVRRVRLGTLKLCDGCGSTYKVVGVAVHAGFDPDDAVNTNDIALLRIAPDQSTDTQTIPSPIAIGTTPIGRGDNLLIYGWGFTHQSSASRGDDTIDMQGHAQTVPKDLQFGSVQKDPKACSREMRQKNMPDSMICLIGKTHNVFSCQGDSGGPLTRKRGRREEIVGLTSWSYGCGDKYPSVYTDVTHYTRWISLAAKQLRAHEGVIKVDSAGAVVPAVVPAVPARRSK